MLDIYFQVVHKNPRHSFENKLIHQILSILRLAAFTSIIKAITRKANNINFFIPKTLGLAKVCKELTQYQQRAGNEQLERDNEDQGQPFNNETS